MQRASVLSPKRGKHTFSKFRFNNQPISSYPHFRYISQTLNLYIFILNILIFLLLIPSKIDSNNPDLLFRYRKEGHLEAKSIGFRMQKLCFQKMKPMLSTSKTYVFTSENIRKQKLKSITQSHKHLIINNLWQNLKIAIILKIWT